MILELLNLKENEVMYDSVHTILTVVPFVNYLEEKVQTGNGVRVQQLKFVLERIKAFPNWDQPIDLDRIKEYRELFELVYITLSAPIADENHDLWAMTIPFTPELFFGTNALYGFLQNKKGQVKDHIAAQVDQEDRDKLRLAFIYNLILKQFYNISYGAQNKIIHHIKDEKTGLTKHFKLDFDSTFLSISYEGILPEINFDNIRLVEENKDSSIDTLLQFLPLSKFTFSGFSIINITDITSQYIMEHIKDVIVNLAPGQMIYDDISASLRELMGNNMLDVSLMPVIKVNNKLVTNCVEGHNAAMQDNCTKYNMPIHTYTEVVQRYSDNPQVIFRKNVQEVMPGEEEIFPVLRGIGVEGLVVVPVFFQKTLVGILSVYAKEKDVLTENMLAALEPAIPLLEQLLQTTIEDFKITIDNTVKEKFTSLQPSVEWRFNEVAFDYLQGKKKDKRAEIDQVFFEDVFPLYGAIDIRNSTLERNNALRVDMQSQLNLLTVLLEKLLRIKEFGLIHEMIYKSKKWLDEIAEFISSDDEFRLNLFFEEDVTPFLLHFRQSTPKSAELINDYFIAIGPTGVAHTHRRALEESLQILNRTIGSLLEQMNVEIQGSYPCYFEKYRSDGIEYDIYIGQSITPQKEFHPMYLKNLRLWQLNSMAIITKLTKALQVELPKKLDTTQLIFVHANTIDISFRSDEHRFDVEGAYNIRYEMIKKRIDKVLIKNTSERLTQPGKIALVYFQQKDVEEYLSHIQYLQDQQILADEVEFLELEELQGVNGLKAIRVSVLLDENEDVLLDQVHELANHHGDK